MRNWRKSVSLLCIVFTLASSYRNLTHAQEAKAGSIRYFMNYEIKKWPVGLYDEISAEEAAQIAAGKHPPAGKIGSSEVLLEVRVYYEGHFDKGGRISCVVKTWDGEAIWWDRFQYSENGDLRVLTHTDRESKDVRIQHYDNHFRMVSSEYTKLAGATSPDCI